MSDISEEREQIGKRLRLAREMAGLSQNQVAKMMGLHRPSVSEMEAGRRRVSVEELKRLCEIYAVDPNWITGISAENKNDARIKMAARELSKLKDDDLNRIIDILKAMKSSPQESDNDE